jgi:phosphoglycolate phosphatase-like HAD superfamily hydrolase
LQKPRVTAVITDLDNTLFDWVEIWYAGFKPLLDGLVTETGLPVGTLEREFAEVHKRHGTSEYAFAIQELPSLAAKYPGEDLPKKFDEIIHACRKGRKKATRLYPEVLTTLRILRAKGCLIVGYTESMAFYTHRRIKQLGLDGVLDFLYSPPDHALPADAALIRSLPADEYRLLHTEHRHTPDGELKPNPALLLDIIAQTGAWPAETVYVGDGLIKDITMAQSARVMDVYAQYGEVRDREDYQLLRRVTHWRPELVQSDRSIQVKDVRPSFTLPKSFAELLDLFEFDRPTRGSADPNLSLVVESWKQTVEVQQHFNDLELRIRNFAITILFASVGGAGFAAKEHLGMATLNVPSWVFGMLVAVVFLGLSALTTMKDVRWWSRALAAAAGILSAFVHHVWTFSLTLPSLLLLGGLVGWGLCYFMDRFWYHRLLLGAVKQGQYIERRFRDVLPEIGLTGAIGASSPIYLGKRSGKAVFEIHTDQKIDLFYLVVIAMLLLGAYTLSVAPLASMPDPTATTTSTIPTATPMTTTPTPTTPTTPTTTHPTAPTTTTPKT